MTAFDPTAYELVRANLRTLPAGQALVHSHRWNPATGDFPFNAFNPRADTRFAGVLAKPRRGGYYAGTTPACALWEADLRNVVGDELGQVAITAEQLQHRRLSFVLTARPLQILDLTPSALAGMAVDKATQHRWSALTSIDQHAPTHAPAAALLAQLADWGMSVDAIAWFSRQCGTDSEHPLVYAFFEPPAAPKDFIEDPNRPAITLVSEAGWTEIDRALAMAKLTRSSSGIDVGTRLAPPSTDDEA